MSKPDTGKFHSSYIGMNVCGSAYENGCVVDGMYATVLLLLFNMSFNLHCHCQHYEDILLL